MLLTTFFYRVQWSTYSTGSWILFIVEVKYFIDDLVQDCSNSTGVIAISH